MPVLSDSQIYNYAIQAGFPPETAAKMVAIAIRESGGNPFAYNGNTKTGDNSYGLWQINMIGAIGEWRRKILGLSDNSELLDPLTNAKAAYTLWAGNDDNLNKHWYINKNTPWISYKDLYEKYLGRGYAAATGGITNTGGGSNLNVFGNPTATTIEQLPNNPMVGSSDIYVIGGLAILATLTVIALS